MTMLVLSLIHILYRIFRESRKTLLVADDVFAVPLVMDMKNFKDYSYEFCGLAFLGEKPENGEVGGMSVVAGACLLYTSGRAAAAAGATRVRVLLFAVVNFDTAVHMALPKVDTGGL